mmetsp:Transcript_20670/g.29900  ORF Transcript_20670/g.29900 Transcript_20670/m.29900 type:complete len:148 (+) Transcript_20670:71-514(+)
MHFSVWVDLILIALVFAGASAFQLHKARTLPSHLSFSRFSLRARSRNEDESWFVKTEQFKKPFPEVKPHLEAHRAWITELRESGFCVTSGYRVDAEGRPGGGGLMIFAATNYSAAEALVLQDPLVANNCVDWQLNGWIAEVGELDLR